MPAPAPDTVTARMLGPATHVPLEVQPYTVPLLDVPQVPAAVDVLAAPPAREHHTALHLQREMAPNLLVDPAVPVRPGLA